MMQIKVYLFPFSFLKKKMKYLHLMQMRRLSPYKMRERGLIYFFFDFSSSSFFGTFELACGEAKTLHLQCSGIQHFGARDWDFA